jgi:uncharacterized membrane-anchored protein
MLGAPSAGQPSLKHELAKSLHAGDIAVYWSKFWVSPPLFVAFSPFLVEPLRDFVGGGLSEIGGNIVTIFVIGCLVLHQR